jgi:hypothetical protein
MPMVSSTAITARWHSPPSSIFSTPTTGAPMPPHFGDPGVIRQRLERHDLDLRALGAEVRGCAACRRKDCRRRRFRADAAPSASGCRSASSSRLNLQTWSSPTALTRIRASHCPEGRRAAHLPHRRSRRLSRPCTGSHGRLDSARSWRPSSASSRPMYRPVRRRGPLRPKPGRWRHRRRLPRRNG